MYLRVHVNAGAKKETLVVKKENEFLISVREPAERNLANRRVCELVAIKIGVPTKAVRIISGHHSATKLLSVETSKT